MIDKQQDFLTLTGAARRARSEGYDITYHSLRNLVAAGYISHVPNGSRIYIFYPNLVNLSRMGSRLSRAWITSSPAPATNSTIRLRHPPDAGGIFEASLNQ